MVLVATSEPELATGAHGDLPDDDHRRIDKARLLSDPGYLLAVVCQQFQQVDTYHRGLITAASFSRALEAVGLRYGQKEVEDILQHCTITDDGYVHYKELLKAVGPLTPRAKQTTLKGTIFPRPEESQQQRPATPAGATPARSRPPVAGLAAWDGRTDEVRWVYSRWEHGTLSSAAFKAELRDMGITPTDELDHLLVVYGPSRGMPFRKLMHALQIDENDGRRARNAHGGCVEAMSPAIKADSAGGSPVAREASGLWQPAPPRMAWGASEQPTNGSVRRAICEFVDGQIPAVAFRQQLRRCGVSMTATLDRLIRTHECDNSVRFQDLARLLLLQDKREQTAEGSAMPIMPHSGGRDEVEVPLASGAQTPMSSASGCGKLNSAGHFSDLGHVPTGSRTPSDLRYGTPPDPRGGGAWQAVHRGQRQDDVRSLLSQSHHSQHSQGGRSRSAASGFHGQRQHLDDSRSVASNLASEACDSSCVCDDAYYTPPPFATTWDLSAPRPHPAARSASAARARPNSGDIIGWKDRPEQEPPPPPPRGAGTAAEALLRWPGADGRGPEQETPSRSGKRYYGTPLSAGDAAPFGRATDIEPPGQRRAPIAAPFGTDQDLRFQRPEDAGTDEYRCAVRMSRRAY